MPKKPKVKERAEEVPEVPAEPPMLTRKSSSQSSLAGKASKLTLDDRSSSFEGRKIRIDGFIFEENNNIFSLQNTTFVSNENDKKQNKKRLGDRLAKIEADALLSGTKYHRFSVATEFINPSFTCNINHIGGLDKGFITKKYLTKDQKSAIEKAQAKREKRKREKEVELTHLREKMTKVQKGKASDDDAPAARLSRRNSGS